jgi:membrane fusion protein (multidrug efflux system)
VKPVLKTTVWILVIAAAITGLAVPKVLPVLRAYAADGTSAAGQEAVADKSSAAGASGARSKSGGSVPLKVATFLVKPAPFAEIVTSTGTLRAEESVELQPEINGKVIAINFSEGSRVRKGALLVKLNDADLRATLASAMLRRELAMLRERRMAQVLKLGVARQEDYDTALSELNVQNAAIDLTLAQIAKTEIRAPFDGVVGLRYVSEGAFVSAATRIATLQRLDTLKIDFSLPEKYAGRIGIGTPITFSVAGADHKFQGEIYAIDPRIDSATRTILIRAVCANRGGRVLPGAFANVETILTQLQDALLVPAVAVVPGLNEKDVFVIKDGKAERRPVQMGTRTETTVHIISGLKPGDLVITSGLQQMHEGQAVIAGAAERS